MNGGLYRGAKPVMWSIVEKTALAEAEVEYHEHRSDTVFVRFPIMTAPNPALAGVSVVIWTTTPWTMPGNRAIAYGADFDYVALRVDAVAEDSKARVGERLALGAGLVESVAKETGILAWTIEAPISPARSPPIRYAARAMISMSACCPAASSPPIPAPASSIWRPAMARMIGNSASPMASRCR
jgi:isoleucyl-tRNA synthetase